jgi:uncharacterized protein (AIM24 family)
LWQKKKSQNARILQLGAGFFGGEGFILQRLRGDGMAFVHAGGTVIEKW